ncbi:MAG: SOS response-associated peptidase [Gemmatimonadota bacterium]|nr:MAG: SOS response-associated peptidase [Gemmatimonadota bacterium]
MCGRYSLATPLDDLIEVFDVPPIDFAYRPRYNVAPTQAAPVVAAGERGTRMGLLRWGLVPFWAKDVGIGSRMINARAETLLEKPAFKRAIHARRCLVPADGFYEWYAGEYGKSPFWIHSPGRIPIAFAGLWERWDGGEGEPLFTFTIITTEASPAVSGIHHRMPAILEGDARTRWLDRDRPGEEAVELLVPFEGELMAHEVSKIVNSPANDVPECRDPIEGCAP